MKRIGRQLLIFAALAAVVGCQGFGTAPPPTTQDAAPRRAELFRPYVPTTLPTEVTAEALPTAPGDARPRVPLQYSIEIWTILLPRDSVSLDEKFWKRVEEPVSAVGQQLLKNGFRVGELPASDLETVRKLIEDRGGDHTTYNGTNGRQVEIPVKADVADQLVFHFDRSDALIGRTWERCDNLFYFSFETTPRSPDRLRVSLTPAVKSRERKMQYAVAPGKADRELTWVTEESHYDVTVAADLSLDRILVIAPSPAARQSHSLGGIFLMDEKPAMLQERLILMIPHAFTVGDKTAEGG